MGYIQKTITFDEWVWNTYLSEVDGNFSKHIQKLVIIGHEATEGKFEFYKKQVIVLTNKITDLQVENTNLKMLVERLKKRSGKSPEFIIEKYKMDIDDITLLKECQDVVSKKPQFVEGNWQRFRNDTRHDITLADFKVLMAADLDNLNGSGHD